MQPVAAVVALLFLTMFAPLNAHAALRNPCDASDAVCANFAKLYDDDKYDEIVKQTDPKAKYSEGSRALIGRAFLAIAGKEENTPEQEEAYCRKALEYGQPQAYMGLYFLTAQKDPKTALGYLREYITTKPADSVPYVILGESALDAGDAKAADAYLREAKAVTRSYSARVDWLLFRANYLLGDYTAASGYLDGALAHGDFSKNLKEILAEKSYAGIEARPEFGKHKDAFAKARSL